MRVREVTKADFGAVFGNDEAKDGKYVYYLTADNIGLRKDTRTNSIEVVGGRYEDIHVEQLEKDILNSVCGDFKGYEIEPTNRPFWEWEEEARPNLFLYYLPEIGIVTFILLLVLFFIAFKQYMML